MTREQLEAMRKSVETSFHFHTRAKDKAEYDRKMNRNDSSPERDMHQTVACVCNVLHKALVAAINVTADDK
ncbi:hypothetical protein CC53_gp123 [Rhizobium phage vB_RleS_L338C]|uniref:hypothetical protein n=1 Tax=Rhizobium phage vB_RleS_L338C TaxID=1414737 RepID=UPI0003D7E89A|nr:hypothetical protein CC53_gp123 [Rhizobium phage vB_RleS_L338C]AHC30540.1 hypothetical protein L338C_123 [Rhizobium phage vB_RleS_L338C]QNH72172.1 hypothetical protein P11VFA_027 [Rhizobium phage P11VFA]